MAFNDRRINLKERLLAGNELITLNTATWKGVWIRVLVSVTSWRTKIFSFGKVFFYSSLSYWFPYVPLFLISLFVSLLNYFIYSLLSFSHLSRIKSIFCFPISQKGLSFYLILSFLFLCFWFFFCLLRFRFLLPGAVYISICFFWLSYNNFVTLLS